MPYPTSCDTFVCLPSHTKDNVMIFGKNSDRPADEVQEIVYYPGTTAANSNTRLRCTYIEIDEVPATAAVILSKPSWMWGAEMGSNSYGVAIGNEAVWTKVEPDSEKKLLGMDLVRLGLERGKTARVALDWITRLLETYGQGGSCSNIMKDLTYHNSYIIADPDEAWVLETVGRLWAAEKVVSGYRNISNSLSIGTKMDLMSKGLKEEAEKLGYWQPPTEFNFKDTFADKTSCSRFQNGKDLLSRYSCDNEFDVKKMMSILRDEESGINMGGYDGGFASTSSQVSLLRRPENEKGDSFHWFTGTPDPMMSIFKPFIFLHGVSPSVTTLTTSPHALKHPLYKHHESAYTKILKEKKMREEMENLENKFHVRVEEFQRKSQDDRMEKYCSLFHEAAEAECKIYSSS